MHVVCDDGNDDDKAQDDDGADKNVDYFWFYKRWLSSLSNPAAWHPIKSLSHN